MLSGVIIMLSLSSKFLVCVPRFSRQNERFRAVGRAVVRVAEMLEADVEVSQRKDVLSIWVYYKNSENMEIPVYSDWEKDWDENHVFHAIRNKLYGMSFDSNHPVLQVVGTRL